MAAARGFMRFLKKRSKEKGVISIEEFAEELTKKMHNAYEDSRRRSIKDSPFIAPSIPIRSALWQRHKGREKTSSVSRRFCGFH